MATGGVFHFNVALQVGPLSKSYNVSLFKAARSLHISRV